MILLPSRAVDPEQLPTRVLVPRGNGRLEIQYQRWWALFWFRLVFVLLWWGVMLAFWAAGELGTEWKRVGAVGVCLLIFFICTIDTRLILDPNTRAIRSGAVFLGWVPLGSSPLTIRDEDRVVVQVTNHDGEHRHNPMYAVLIRRKGWLRGDIGLIEVTLPKSNPHPALLAFAKLVGELMQIEHQPKIDTSKMKGNLSDLEYPL